MTTAFQPNAFQKNAFQIGVFGVGDASSAITKKKKRIITRIVKKYEQIAQSLPEEKLLIAAVDQYIAPTTQQERERRQKAQFIVTSVPDVSRVRWTALVDHQMAFERITAVIDRLMKHIAEQRRKREEEEITLMLLMEVI